MGTRAVNSVCLKCPHNEGAIFYEGCTSACCRPVTATCRAAERQSGPRPAANTLFHSRLHIDGVALRKFARDA